MRLYHARRVAVSWFAELALRAFAWQQALGKSARPEQQKAVAAVSHPARPEDIDPLARGNIEDPYAYYKLLRDQRPVYKPDGSDFYCVSRYQDIQELTKKTEEYSSNMMGVLVGQRRGRPISARALAKAGRGGQRNSGVEPVDVLAIQDPPAHTYQRAVSQGHLSLRYLKSLESQVRVLADELLQPLAQGGQLEFMRAVAWKLPMTMALRLVGFPESDYPQVKEYCSAAVALLSGANTPGEFAANSAAVLRLYRYCWSEYLKARREPHDDLTGALIKAVDDPANPMTDEEAVSIVMQILIAGSDSSASTMGNAVKMLVEHPHIEQRLRREPERVGDFVEEVLRLESPFQGHFRVTRQDTSLHGVALPKGTRVFLLWASANRDERFWENPDSINLDREKLRQHLSFGYGLHSCLGRELARLEIRIVVTELLKRTQRLTIVGPTPRVTSMFVRTLVKLPISSS